MDFKAAMNYTNDTNGGMKKHSCIRGSKTFVDFKAATSYTNDTNGGMKKHLCIRGSKLFERNKYSGVAANHTT